jgi:hypothetical protein
MQELFSDELGADAAASLDAPSPWGSEECWKPCSVKPRWRTSPTEAFRAPAGSNRSTLGSQPRFRGWTLSSSASDERLTALIDAARVRLGAFATADRCVFGMTAKVATWKQD